MPDVTTAAATMRERLEAWHDRAPDDLAASEGDRLWTVRELLDRADTTARSLLAAGVVAGDTVAWWGGPSLDFAAVLLATWRVDATYVGINPRYTAREIAALFDRARPRLIVHGESRPTVAGEPPTPDARWLSRVRARSSLIARSTEEGSDGIALPGATGSHPALIVFTTGSTGQPKGALISHRSIAAASRGQAASMNRSARCTINALPVNHIGGLVNITTAAWWDGQHIAFVPAFTPEAIIAALHRFEAVRLPAVPMLFRRCLDTPGFAAAARGRLVHALSGGAPLPRAVRDDLTMLEVDVQGMYGQTEMSGSACYTGPDDDAETTCSTVGRPPAGVDVRLAPLDGTDGDLREGELQVRGPQVFDGYLEDPEATRQAFTADGWLRSGDLAVRRTNGTIQLTGRLREVINTRGFKVMPREIEDTLLLHPAVASAAVVGARSAAFGETIVAFVTLHENVPAETSAIRDWCRDHLAHFKVPGTVVRLDSMPLLGVGKIDKLTLAARAAGVVHE